MLNNIILNLNKIGDYSSDIWAYVIYFDIIK